MATHIILQKKKKEDEFGYLIRLTISNKKRKKTSLGIKISESDFLKYYNKEFNSFSPKWKRAKELNSIINEEITEEKEDINKGIRLSKFIEEIKKEFKISTGLVYNTLKKDMLKVVGKDIYLSELEKYYPMYLKFLDSKSPSHRKHKYKAFWAVYNRAKRDKLIDCDIIKPKFTAPKKHVNYLTKGEVMKLEEVFLPKRLEVVRDIWLFQMYAGGLRFSDLFSLKFGDVRDGSLRKKQSKTNGVVSNKISLKGARILDKLFEFGIFEQYENFNLKIDNQVISKGEYIQKLNTNLFDTILYKGYTIDSDKKMMVDNLIANSELQAQLAYQRVFEELRQFDNNEYIFTRFFNKRIFEIFKKNDIVNGYVEYMRVRDRFNVNLGKITEYYQKEFNSTIKITTHVARYTYCNVLLEGGADISVVSKAMGHKDMSITEVYIAENFGNAKRNEATSILDNLFKENPPQ